MASPLPQWRGSMVRLSLKLIFQTLWALVWAELTIGHPPGLWICLGRLLLEWDIVGRDTPMRDALVYSRCGVSGLRTLSQQIFSWSRSNPCHHTLIIWCPGVLVTMTMLMQGSLILLSVTTAPVVMNEDNYEWSTLFPGWSISGS